MKRGREPCAPAPERILPAPSNIPDCGATTAICPRISTVPRSAHLPSGLTPGSCWEGTLREYWRIATGKGRFMTWVLEEGEPDVATAFRIEADPVVNANVIAYLGGHPETRDARRWLEAVISEGRLDGSSKWYPDTVTIYHAVTRAMIRAHPALDHLRPILAERILGLRDEKGEFGNVLRTAQAVSALSRYRGTRKHRRETRSGKVDGCAT